jgi:hypothetical protein
VKSLEKCFKNYGFEMVKGDDAHKDMLNAVKDWLEDHRNLPLSKKGDWIDLDQLITEIENSLELPVPNKQIKKVNYDR